jgi:hypothetical protein
MLTYPLKSVHIVDATADGRDVVELETVSGYIEQVDPKTRRTTGRRQRFIVESREWADDRPKAVTLTPA